MATKQKQKKNHASLSVGNQILGAVTKTEAGAFLDALLSSITPEQQAVALACLAVNTRQSIEALLTSESATATAPVVSDAKLVEKWHTLWREWHAVITEASDENGEYYVQEEHWEPPYFDEYGLIRDLEKVATKMRPLIPVAFATRASDEAIFIDELVDMEYEVSSSMPEWIELTEGFHLEENLTLCLLEWEWLAAQDEGEDAYQFAARIRDTEDKFSSISLYEQALTHFFGELSKADQETVFAGLRANREEEIWRSCLQSTHSPWHHLYMGYIDQYAPEAYLDNLRLTIPQAWENGLPILEDLLQKQDYQNGNVVVQEVMDSFLNRYHRQERWTPQSALIYTIVSGYSNVPELLQSIKTLLDYYQQVAAGLGDKELSATINIHLTTLDHFYDWQIVFKILLQSSVIESTRQALFHSWKTAILQHSHPQTWGDRYGRQSNADEWWLRWLLESTTDTEKGPTWYQAQTRRWLDKLSAAPKEAGSQLGVLRLLTADLASIDGNVAAQYPLFFARVIQPQRLTTKDEASRRAYLAEYAVDDLLNLVMVFWQKNLQTFVPKPEKVHKADYTSHAQWMAALQEVSPQNYATLLADWRQTHARRINLWKAMRIEQLG